MFIFGPRFSDVRPRLAAALAVLAVCAACGKKGAPLAPLNLAPEAPKPVTARRLGDTVYLQLAVPQKNMTGRGAYSVDRIDVYAITVAPGVAPPVSRDFIKPAYVVGNISIQPPPDPDAPEPDTPDPRPKPGDTITWGEKLTAATLAPTTLVVPKHQAAPATPKAPKAPKGTGKKGAEPSPTAAAAPPPPAGPPVLTRFYMLMGVPKKGRGAAPSARVDVPLLQAPAAPRPTATSADETSVTLTWQPPPSSTDEVPGVLYNVYAVPAGGPPADGGSADRPSAPVPLNDKPISDTSFTHQGAEPDREQCFVVRSVAAVGNAAIESDASAPLCITPKDTFPPAAPRGLAAVGSAGAINLIWDANTEADLAGYIVLRGDAAGATLQPLMREPIKDTRYTDRTAVPGARYAYQVIAVDKAGNRSAPSNRVDEAAR